MTALEKLTFTVMGMGCDGCVAAIENAVLPLAGVLYVGVSLSSGTMTIRPGKGLDVAELTKRVGALGYGLSAGTSIASVSTTESCACWRTPAHSPNGPTA